MLFLQAQEQEVW